MRRVIQKDCVCMIVSECAKYARLTYTQSKTELTELPDPTATLPDEPQTFAKKILKWFCRWPILQKIRNLRTDKIANGTKASFYVEWLKETEKKMTKYWCKS